MRLIDADKLKDSEVMCKVFSNQTDELYGMLQLINEQLTVDAVEVVRCKDCKYRADVDEPNICGVCKLVSNRYCDGEDSCSYGERKDGER